MKLPGQDRWPGRLYQVTRVWVLFMLVDIQTRMECRRTVSTSVNLGAAAFYSKLALLLKLVRSSSPSCHGKTYSSLFDTLEGKDEL